LAQKKQWIFRDHHRNLAPILIRGDHIAMTEYRKPAHWKVAKNKLFPHQVGFTCPPHDWDGAPSDFLRMSPDSVGVHGWMLHVPDYRHLLDQRKQNFGMMEDFVQCMANNGADVCGQVGSNWVHASGLGVEGIRKHCEMLSEKYETPFHMAGYAMVEALRAMNVEKVALNAAYHWPTWWQGTVGFLREAGFDVIWAGNFVDQGWFKTQEEVNACIWCFDGDLAQKSFDYVADKAPNVDAYLINGMCNFRRPGDSLAQRPVHLAAGLEQRLGKPVIGHDIALHWRIFKTLGIAPATPQGSLLSTLKD
jgi:maleate cis-trans isomerase